MNKTHRHLVRPPHFHLAEAATGKRGLRALVAEVDGFNAKAAVVIANVLSSMWTFWVFCVLALCSLPAVLVGFDSEVLKGALGLAHVVPSVIVKASLIALVSWVAQTLIQLTALAVLGYIGNATQQQNDANVKVILTDGEATREHTEKILDTLDLRTIGGLHDVMDAIEALHTKANRLLPPDEPAGSGSTPS